MPVPIGELAPTARARTITQTQTWAAQVTGSPDIFTIANGAIYVEMFIAWVSTALTSVGATNLYYEFTPATLAAGIEDLCTTLVITNDPIDTIYTMTGDITVAMAEEDNGLCLTPSLATNHWILGPGVVNMNLTCGTSVTGVVVTSMVYRPLNALVTVVAA